MLTSPLNCPGPWTAPSVSALPDTRTTPMGALRDHEKRHHVIAGFDLDVGVPDGTHRPMRRTARDLRGGEHGKHVVRARRGAKSRWTLSQVPSYSWRAVISRTS